MNEPTVQVPVSLIERARQAYEDHGWKSDPLVSQLAILLGKITEAASQPTPSAEPDEWCREEGCRHRHWRSGPMPTHRRGEQCPAPSATQPSIADMAPGTTFRCGLYSFTVVDNFAQREDGLWYHRDEFIDPSTIRDVTPPA